MGGRRGVISTYPSEKKKGVPHRRKKRAQIFFAAPGGKRKGIANKTLLTPRGKRKKSLC